jgi:dsDNA-binding SOS-regulon protein
MAALNIFISKLGEWGLPFFKLLKHQEKFTWTSEADQALAQLKEFLSKPPVLTAPRKKEQLLLYLASTTHVVSTAIVVEWRKTATPTQSSDQSTSSAKSCRNLRNTINQYRSYCMKFSSPRGIYDTTSRSTRSPSSPM